VLSFLNTSSRKNSSNVEDRVPNLDPFISGTITGFTMGEGSFSISISKSKTYRSGYQVKPEFKIQLKKSDSNFLEFIRATLGCGEIRYGENSVVYVVGNRKDLMEVIIPFFEKYPLKNIKEIDFQYFKMICYKLQLGEGKSINGIRRILSVRDLMNDGGHKSRNQIIL